MGKITGADLGNFKSAKYIYSKIKRELKNFGAANLLDDADFPLYTAEVLNKLGNSAYREEETLLHIKNGKAELPRDFKQIYAAYKCKCSSTIKGGPQLQNRRVFTDTVYDTFRNPTGCEVNRCEVGNLVSSITIRQFVDDSCIEHDISMTGLLTLSPNVRQHCSEQCLNQIPTCSDEITINSGCIFTNFKHEDIFLQYYAFPFDENGDILIPDIPSVEKAIEWYIKKEILLNNWLTGDLQDVQNRWQAAERIYDEAFGEARFNGKLPAFSTLVNSIRTKRSINPVAYFMQMDHNRLH